MRKVFLEELPKWKTGGNKGKINWRESIGYMIRFVYEDLDDYLELVGYDGSTNKIKIKYNGVEYEKDTSGFKRAKLGLILKKRTDDFKIEIGDNIKDQKRNFIITDVMSKKDNSNRTKKYYKYKCLNCGFDCGEHYLGGIYKGDHWTSEGRLLNKKCTCVCCNNQITAPGINDIPTTAPWMVKYFQGGYKEAKKYCKSSNKSILFICPDCNRVKVKNTTIATLFALKSIGCTCGDGFSYGHKYISMMLKQLNIEYIDNFSPIWCRYFNELKNKESYGEYDFVIESHKLIVEVDGSFHRNDNGMNGQTKEESEYVDSIKDRLAKENGYEIIRIFYDDDVFTIKKYIIESDILKILNREHVDWGKCEEFALSNRIKSICNYWNNKKDNENVTIVAKTFGIDRSTAMVWLNKGTELGWCNYDPKYEKIKGSTKKNKTGKKVLVFKDGIAISDAIPSCAELERKSLDLFGIKFRADEVSEVCRGIKSEYKGYTFKFVE